VAVQEQTDSPLDLSAAIECWPAVVNLVRTENAMLAALLEEARPVATGGQNLVLAFPAGAAFLKRKAEQDDHRRAAVEALRAVTGQRMTLSYELRENGIEGAGESDGISTEELVRRFMEEFNAEEILDDDADEATT
jgi:hypothetical protein